MDNYDNTMKEPTLLPATFPNVLVSTPTRASPWAWPSQSARFNLAEVCDTTIALLKDPDARHRLHPAWRRIFPRRRPAALRPGGQLEEIYRTGRGSVQVRARYAL